MTTATNTIIGDIQLAGDLAGNNNGLAPALTASGVTAGSYTIPTLTIDTKGRVTAASSNTITGILPIATTSAAGMVQPDGTTISVSSGVISVAAATSSTFGVVSIGSNINVSAGAISVPTATSSVLGVVKPDGTTITNTAGAISVPTATSSVLGVVKPDGTTIINSSGAISVPTATTSGFGIVKPDGTTVTISAGTISAATVANVAYVNVANTYSAVQWIQPFTISGVTGTTSVTGAESNIYYLNSTLTGNLTINITGTVVIGTTYYFVLGPSFVNSSGYSVALQLGGAGFATYTPALSTSGTVIRRYLVTATSTILNTGAY